MNCARRGDMSVIEEKMAVCCNGNGVRMSIFHGCSIIPNFD